MNSENRIIKARAKLMKGNIGMASMLLNLELIEANERCDTMATDGINIYWLMRCIELYRMMMKPYKMP